MNTTRENEGAVRKASLHQHSILAKGGLLGVAGSADTPVQRASLGVLSGNIGISLIEDLTKGNFVMGVSKPQEVADDIRAEAAPPASVIPLVLLLVVSASVLGFVAKVVADTHEGRHCGVFNRELYLEFTNADFTSGRKTRVMVVVEGSPLYTQALKF